MEQPFIIIKRKEFSLCAEDSILTEQNLHALARKWIDSL